MIALLLVLALLSPRDAFRQEVNAERDCRLRATGPRLEQEARAWSRHMARLGRITHSVLELPRKWRTAGEVVGVGRDWREVLAALWASPEHARILRDCAYQKIAIGIVRAGGRTWITGRLYG